MATASGYEPPPAAFSMCLFCINVAYVELGECAVSACGVTPIVPPPVLSSCARSACSSSRASTLCAARVHCTGLVCGVNQKAVCVRDPSGLPQVLLHALRGHGNRAQGHTAHCSRARRQWPARLGVGDRFAVQASGPCRRCCRNGGVAVRESSIVARRCLSRPQGFGIQTPSSEPQQHHVICQPAS